MNANGNYALKSPVYADQPEMVLSFANATNFALGHLGFAVEDREKIKIRFGHSDVLRDIQNNHVSTSLDAFFSSANPPVHDHVVFEIALSEYGRLAGETLGGDPEQLFIRERQDIDPVTIEFLGRLRAAHKSAPAPKPITTI